MTRVRDNKALKSPIQLLLEQIISIRTLKVVNLTTDAVESFYGLLLAAQTTQLSLTSVWSFQEGILFGDTTRPQVANSTTCQILDHNGEAYGKNVDYLNGGDYVLDIVGLTTNIFEIATAALDNMAIGRPLPSSASHFEKWVYAEEAKTRDLLSRLIGKPYFWRLNVCY